VVATPKPATPRPTVVATTPKSSGGSAMVQIGAFSSAALADRGWSDAASVAPGLAAGKGKQVEAIDKDGKTLFRTSVTGFSSRAEAQTFCERLKGAGKSCFVK
jgi:cell division septation protein DedD